MLHTGKLDATVPNVMDTAMSGARMIHRAQRAQNVLTRPQYYDVSRFFAHLGQVNRFPLWWFRFFSDLYDLYDLYDLAHVARWELYKTWMIYSRNYFSWVGWSVLYRSYWTCIDGRCRPRWSRLIVICLSDVWECLAYRLLEKKQNKIKYTHTHVMNLYEVRQHLCPRYKQGGIWDGQQYYTWKSVPGTTYQHTRGESKPMHKWKCCYRASVSPNQVTTQGRSCSVVRTVAYINTR